MTNETQRNGAVGGNQLDVLRERRRERRAAGIDRFGRPLPRRAGRNPRALGTNPRAQQDRDAA